MSFGLEALIFELSIQFQSALGAAHKGEGIDILALSCLFRLFVYRADGDLKIKLGKINQALPRNVIVSMPVPSGVEGMVLSRITRSNQRDWCVMQ